MTLPNIANTRAQYQNSLVFTCKHRFCIFWTVRQRAHRTAHVARNIQRLCIASLVFVLFDHGSRFDRRSGQSQLLPQLLRQVVVIIIDLQNLRVHLLNA
jgi:hypothetical protein